MKPLFEAVGTSLNGSFLVRKFTEKYFSAPYHYHPEYELTLIVRGSGTRYVGTHIQEYTQGDLVLLAPNLPHCWKTSKGAVENSVSVVVHFKEDFLGERFFNVPEIKKIAQLLKDSHKGVRFHYTDTVGTVMGAILKERNRYKKLILLLDLLYHLSSAAKYTRLQKQVEFDVLTSHEKERIHRVLAYIVEHFHKEISLKTAAAIANMSTHAFCKYFKKTTRKTFVETVNDYKIDFAARELINSDKSVSQVCFDSGFNDVSNFHRAFRARLHTSPLQYRNLLS